jgi:hypothetical protein
VGPEEAAAVLAPENSETPSTSTFCFGAELPANPSKSLTGLVFLHSLPLQDFSHNIAPTEACAHFLLSYCLSSVLYDHVMLPSSLSGAAVHELY